MYSCLPGFQQEPRGFPHGLSLLQNAVTRILPGFSSLKQLLLFPQEQQFALEA